jgi:RimJ/RimL family protein N-acetyltransferase
VTPDPVEVRLELIPAAAMSALLEGDLAGARGITGLPLTPFFTDERAQWLWRYRVEQIARDPGAQRWIVRAAVDVSSGEVVGHAGFHGPPDGAGMVEVGYSTDPALRRRGYARAMLRALLRWAAQEPPVRIVRASISPDNVASLATVARFGFARVGEQRDEDDGLELIFERPVDGLV